MITHKGAFNSLAELEAWDRQMNLYRKDEMWKSEAKITGDSYKNHKLKEYI